MFGRADHDAGGESERGEAAIIRFSSSEVPLSKHLLAALAAGDATARLNAALAIGGNPEPFLVDELVARCAVEPDFVHAHARAIERLLRHPEAASELASKEAKRQFVLGKEGNNR